MPAALSAPLSRASTPRPHSLSMQEFWWSRTTRDVIAYSLQTRSWISSTGFARRPRADRLAYPSRHSEHVISAMARIVLHHVPARLSYVRPIVMADTPPSLRHFSEHGAASRDGPAMLEENCSA